MLLDLAVWCCRRLSSHAMRPHAWVRFGKNPQDLAGICTMYIVKRGVSANAAIFHVSLLSSAPTGRGASDLAPTGKDYDPTAAAREDRERRERRHKAAMEKRQEKELADCTFKPAVSRRSVELQHTIQKERPSLHSPIKTPSRMAYKGPAAQVRISLLTRPAIVA